MQKQALAIDYPAVLVLFGLPGLIVWITGWRRPPQDEEKREQIVSFENT